MTGRSTVLLYVVHLSTFAIEIRDINTLCQLTDVRKLFGRQGDAPATWRMSVTPLAFCLYPPLHPPAGEFPTAHPTKVSRGSRHSGASAMSRPLHFLHSFDRPASFSFVRPLASLYLSSVIGRFFKDAPTHPPSIRYLLSLTLSIVAQAKGSGRQG